MSQCLRPATLLKKRLWHRCFPANLTKFLRTLFLWNTYGWLLLYIIISTQNRDRKERKKSATHRSSRQRCSFRKAVLKHFAIFTGKHLLLESLFKKVADLKPCNFIKKKLQHRCFSVNIAEFLRTPILKNICERLLLSIPISGQCAHDLQKAFCCFQVVWNGNIGQKWVNPF